MADAYGMVTLSKSDDCFFDSEKLKECLNQFEWDNSGAKWSISTLGNLYLDEYYFDRPQYPTAFPKEVNLFEMFDAEVSGLNASYTKTPEEMTEEDWDRLEGTIEIPISLQKLSSLISPIIDSGWIEVACVGNEKTRYVYFELFRIYADGRAYLKAVTSGPFTDLRDSFEEYLPNKSLA